MQKIFNNNGRAFAESLREAMQETTDLESFAGETLYTQDDDPESNFSKLQAKAFKLMAKYVTEKNVTNVTKEKMSIC